MRHSSTWVLCALLLLGACAGPERSTLPARDSAASQQDDAAKEGTEAKPHDSTEGKDGKTSRSETKENDPSSGGGSEGSSGEDFTAGANEDDVSEPVAPAAGTYVYDQQGWEEFCQATCERSQLPDRAKTDIAYQRRGDGATALTNEMRSSDGRLVRTTFIYTSDEALITQVYAKFTYEGFTLSEQYEPRPAVTAFNFPLRTGATWSGSWKDDVSGDYRVQVIAEERTTIGGSTVTAVKVATDTTFRGEYQGTAHAVAWIDPATRAVVATSGDVDLKSSFGSYHTKFATHLLSGPAYR